MPPIPLFDRNHLYEWSDAMDAWRSESEARGLTISCEVFKQVVRDNLPFEEICWWDKCHIMHKDSTMALVQFLKCQPTDVRRIILHEFEMIDCPKLKDYIRGNVDIESLRSLNDYRSMVFEATKTVAAEQQRLCQPRCYKESGRTTVARQVRMQNTDAVFCDFRHLHTNPLALLLAVLKPQPP